MRSKLPPSSLALTLFVCYSAIATAEGPAREPDRSARVAATGIADTTGAAITPGGSISIELASVATGDPEARPGLRRGHVQGEYLDRQPGYSAPASAADAAEIAAPAEITPASRRGETPLAPGDVLRNFDGQTASGWIPPDPVLAVGPKYIVEVVNSGFTIFSKDGGLDRAYTNLETFFAPLFPSLPDPWVAADSFVFDPRVIYTPEHGKFVIFALARDDNHQNSYWFFAISSTSNPLGGWTLYWYWDANNQDTWIDYSGMSADQDGLYFTGNEFFWTGGFKHSVIHAIRPTIFTNTGGAGWIFWDLRWPEPGNPKVFEIQPAVPHSLAGGHETFFVNTFNSSGDKVCLRVMTGDRGNSPTLLAYSVAVGAYADPGLAAQPGAVLDDIEMFYAGALGAAYNQRKVFFSLNDDNANGASFYVSKIDVDAHTQDLVRNLGTADVYYYYPAVGLTTGADAFNPLVGVAMSWSSNSQNPSGAFMLFNDFTNSAAGQFWNVAGGASTYNVYADGRNRWGDYMGIHRDWTCATIWGVTQFTSALNTWRTRITELAGIGTLPAACRLIFDDGFERGSSLNWSSTSS
jgi:hypothetical protein